MNKVQKPSDSVIYHGQNPLESLRISTDSVQGIFLSSDYLV
jgi:hypothetical protein